MRTPQPWVLPTSPTRGRDLEALGIGRARFQSALASGRLVRVRQGVYLASDHWPEDPAARHLLLAAAEQAIQPTAVVSHRSAALVWGLPLPNEQWSQEPVWVTVPAGREFRSFRGARVRQVAAPLPSHHVAVAGAGFRVTTLARTAVDTARDLALPQSLMVLDAALRGECASMVVGLRRRDLGNQRLIDAARRPLQEAAGSLPRMLSLQRCLALADPARESPIESLSFGHMALARLPLPVCQFEVRVSNGSLFPDFYWEHENLVGEADGRVKYSDPDSMIREKEREQILRDLGFGMVRWLGKEIHLTPDVVMARIARALDS